ncbi:Transcription factor bHLH30 [Acorus calamus]|uniref:Transcription factor bHLH30 n=1 Tax=Acorus calamus TaxID=4465 RepID=A0AAV9F3P1_ACOCL|nr:Transcription factor bHLH30 [Acorus calamus]
MGETSFGFSSFNGFSQSFGFNALVLDGGKGELVRAPVGPPVVAGKKGTPASVAAALKSHSEAERRRRERINSHLTTLRSLVPCNDKMDKASLLAKVITHVKDLKRHATEISKGCPVPSDADEVRVEPDEDGMHVNNGRFLIRASLCCEDRPDLLEDLKQTLSNLPLKTLRAEISTLGGRVRNMFVMATEGKVTEIEQHLVVSSAHQALKSVLDRVASPEFSPRSSLSCKRRRISSFDSLSSSS